MSGRLSVSTSGLASGSVYLSVPYLSIQNSKIIFTGLKFGYDVLTINLQNNNSIVK